MKKITYILFFALAAILSFSACDREKMDNDSTEQGEGSINLASLKGLSVDASSTTVTRAADDVNTDNYLIRIYNADEELVQEWKYSELPEIFTLKVGSYSVQALSHEVQPAEFETPYYYAEESFTIEANKVKDLEPMVCRLQNIQVSVTYDDKLKALMGDDVKTTVSIGNASLEFNKDETRSGYFRANKESDNLMTATMTGKIDGNPESVPYPVKNAKAGQHRIIKFYLKYVNDDGYIEGGFVPLKLTVVAQCTVIEKGVIVEQDEEIIPDPNPSEPEGEKPTIAGIGFNIDESITFPIKTTVDVNVKVISPEGLSNLKVKIVSDFLTEEMLSDVGLTSEFDLAYPGEYKEGLKGLGFPVGNEVIGAKDLDFAITQFTALLLEPGTHKFIITAIDQKMNQVEKTLTLISEDK
ncbi:DUF4493 domain-containing protein [Bacteroides sp. GM023]|uniref:DUF4493 domain-containing protein n=1 Tax=Bacteroides sp. GM023 TaxID=2723058 RepID=UPI00168B1666|nr:DUF4493 domain-containing protein [Bacteroides sp. GM023]MBD3591936.1 DUF4493 domain-containing protein [Bacteroides sp. GM023]